MSNGVKSIAQKLLILFLSIAAFYLFFKVAAVTYKRYVLQLRINEAKSQVRQLEKSNEELKKLLAQLSSEEFLTLKAKEELNLKEPGEKVVIVRDKKQLVQKQPQKKEEKRDNWLKWWGMFFK